MNIRCNSCQKEFIVPDSAIPPTGRLVQCSSCGNKWTQFPVQEKSVPKSKVKLQKKELKKEVQSTRSKLPSKKKVSKNKKKTASISVYSKEYLKKKHGISLIDPSAHKTNNIKNSKKEISIGFGFYNYLIIFSVIVIFLVGLLNHTNEIIISYFPFLENYIYYFYETIENLKILLLDLIKNY